MRGGLRLVVACAWRPASAWPRGPGTAAGDEVSYAGGDLVTLGKPKALGSATSVARAWKTISVVAPAGLPEAGVGSVFVV